MIVKMVYITRFVNNIVTRKSSTHQQIHTKRYNVTKNFNFFVNKTIPANRIKLPNVLPVNRFKAIKHNINMIQSNANIHYG